MLLLVLRLEINKLDDIMIFWVGVMATTVFGAFCNCTEHYAFKHLALIIQFLQLVLKLQT